MRTKILTIYENVKKMFTVKIDNEYFHKEEYFEQ